MGDEGCSDSRHLCQLLEQSSLLKMYNISLTGTGRYPMRSEPMHAKTIGYAKSSA